jgi:hypothetical protein
MVVDVLEEEFFYTRRIILSSVNVISEFYGNFFRAIQGLRVQGQSCQKIFHSLSTWLCRVMRIELKYYKHYSSEEYEYFLIWKSEKLVKL